MTRDEIDTMNAIAIAMSGGMTQSTNTHQFPAGNSTPSVRVETIRFTTAE